MSDLPPPSNEGMPPPSGPGYPMDAKDAKANAKGAKAHAKAMRPWYKKKRFIIGGILAIIVVVAIASGGGSDDKSDSASPGKSDKSDSPTKSATDDKQSDDAAADDDVATEEEEVDEAPAVACKDAGADDKVDTQNQDLYPDRPDSQKDDHEAAVGDCVRVSGYTAYVVEGSVQPQDFGGPQTIVSVKLQNRDDSAQSFNMFDWSLLTPSGTVIDPTIYLGDDGLDSGDLVKGGEATGKIAFDVSESGTYYVIYTPDMFDKVRGIWQIDV